MRKPFKFRIFGETFELVGGPNIAFWLVIAVVGIMCFNGATIWPMIYLLGFLAATIIPSLWFHAWNCRQERKMVEDFPHDPFIQAKYGEVKNRKMIEVGRRTGAIT